MEMQTSTGSADPVKQEFEYYWDIDQAAAFLGYGRAELWELAERRCLPAHKLQHGKRYCWKFKPSELLELKRDGLTEQGAAIQ